MDEGSANFFLKSQVMGILGFLQKNTQPCYCNMKAIDNT